MLKGAMKWLYPGKGYGALPHEESQKGVVANASRKVGSRRASRVFSTLTMPNGHRIRIMREDAFRTALAASADKAPR